MIRTALFFLAGIALGFGAGYFFENLDVNALTVSLRSSFVPIQENGSYALVHPLLAYRTPEATSYGEYIDLKSALQSDIANAEKSKDVSRVSIYFRDLDTARWVGINQDDIYYPASLLKVSLLIAYYKEAEINPSVLSRTVTYEPYTDLPVFEAPSSLTVGRVYTVNELLAHMITDSDNGATFTLLDKINPDVLSSVYAALGIAEPSSGSSADYQISARTYGLFFRILYNATYLSPAYSEKALKLLTQATFDSGLVAGTPAGTLVAHKYGEHVLSQGNAVTGIELHDCGVVYYPAHPYLLCVMTSAKDTPTAASVISTIAKTTYDEIASRYPAEK